MPPDRHSTASRTGAPEPPTDGDLSRAVAIFGSGRQGRNILDVCLALDRPVIGFLDDTKAPGTQVNGIPVLGAFGDWEAIARTRQCAFIVGVGWNPARVQTATRIAARGAALASVIHPDCQISRFARIGAGVFISAYCRVLANARIGDHCLVEGHTSVGADAEVGEGVGMGIGVTIAGAARVGPGSFLGSGVVVSGRVGVGAGCVVGANATVIRDLPDRVMAVGSPAAVKKTLTDFPPVP